MAPSTRADSKTISGAERASLRGPMGQLTRANGKTENSTALGSIPINRESRRRDSGNKGVEMKSGSISKKR